MFCVEVLIHIVLIISLVEGLYLIERPIKRWFKGPR